MSDETPRPQSGGSYRRGKDGKLKAVHQPNETPPGGGPRNAAGKPINERGEVIDPATGELVERAEPHPNPTHKGGDQ